MTACWPIASRGSNPRAATASSSTSRAISANEDERRARTRAQIAGALIRRYGSPWSDTRKKPTRLQLRRFQHRLFVAEERQPQFGSSKRRRPVRLPLEGQLWMR
jgi:hypothetical protein